jgi:hypothetical protein
MFGLEKKRVSEYDLEKVLLDNKKCKKLQDDVEKKVNNLKKELMKVEDQGIEDDLSFVLLGYASLLKVINTIN